MRRLILFSALVVAIAWTGQSGATRAATTRADSFQSAALKAPLHFLVHLPADYATIGRAIVGVSAGGYGAAILGVHYLARFAAVESWSGYFRPTDEAGKSTLDVGNDADNVYASVHALAPRLASQIARYPTFIAFYVGAEDPTFVTDNEKLDRELTTASVAHVFEVYAGSHSVSVWQAHATQWLALALRRLAPAG